uniref:Vacuolar protein 8 n=1 Tax=Corethron hystrix TaxID=216773 RepID=A0A7S1G0G3_9STRA|mmetsp:Transcript_5897/g.12491  ORF Transcript_5897/g.12491 Transcript_5897/m.12491 type:complete len:477 (+) Transcript_5897:675-2105(+)
MVFEDICLICFILEKIYGGCSPTSIEESYREIGRTLFQNLINAWDICTNGTCRRDKYIEPIIQIFSHFVNVEEALKYMAGNNELLDVLVRAVDIAFMYTTLTAIHAYCVDPLWIISILTLADSASIVCHSGVLKVLTKASQGHADMKKEVAASILNLSSKRSNHSMLLNHNGILETIRCLLLSTELDARRRAAGALRNLASNKSIRARLISFKRGRIVDALIKVSNGDSKSKASSNAAEALKKLAVGRSSSELDENTELMQTVAKMTCSQNRFVRHFVTKLVINQANITECSVSSCKFISQCLIQIHDTTSSDKASTFLQISEAFLVQSCVLDNQEPMVHHDGFLRTISKLAISKHEVIRQNALSALIVLAKNPANQNGMCSNKDVLETAKKLLRKEGKDYNEARAIVLDLIALLASERENRPLLADCEDLVDAMLSYTESTTNSKEQSDGINTIMLFAPRAVGWNQVDINTAIQA